MIRIPVNKLLCAILSGVMLTASFPPGKLDWVAWFALVPLLTTLDYKHPNQAFRLGLFMGLSHYLTLIYWIVVVLNVYGGLSLFLSVIALLLLCLYLSLYPALFSYLACYLKSSRFSVFFMAGLWVGLEYIRANALTGFPWCLLGYTQFRHTDLIRIANITGVYGLSFLLILSNAFIFMLLFNRNFRRKRFLKWETLSVLLMAVFTMAYLFFGSKEKNLKGEGQNTVRIAIIQGNINQSIKWDPVFQEKTVDIYRRLTRAASGFKPRLVVWPETSLPFFFQENTKLTSEVVDISKESGSDLIFGSPAFLIGKKGTRYYNRAYLLSPVNRSVQYYDKIHLVPFGEYVPYKRFLPFINRLVPAAGDFEAGKKIQPLKLPYLKCGILICFETIFPELARAQAKKGAQILFNLTNDAWFGKTSAPYQHLSMAVFRAVENGIPMVRAANTGISAFIDPDGNIITKSGIFKEAVLKHEVTAGGSSTGFYTRHGDIFAVFLLIISLIKFFSVLYSNMFIGKNRSVLK